MVLSLLFVFPTYIVHVPSVIINQMRFSQFTMLKMFLSAVASSKCTHMQIVENLEHSMYAD